MRIHSRANQGSYLLLVLVLTGVGCFIAAGVVAYAFDMHKINERTIANEKAIATAEAGLAQLRHYFNTPGDLPANCSALATVFTSGDPTKLSGGTGTVINASSNLNASLIQFTEAGATRTVSRVTQLQLTGAQNTASGGLAASPTGTKFRLTSTATASTTRGDVVKRTAVMDVGYSAQLGLSMPAGLITGGNAASNGHFNLHWGAAWSIGNIALKLNAKNKSDGTWSSTGDNTINRNTPDQWVTYESAQGSIEDNGGSPILGSSIYDVGQYNPSGDYLNALYQFVDKFTPAGQQTLTQQINAELQEFEALNDPQKGYNYWKNTAIAHDTYFKVNTNGSISDASGKQTFGSIEAAIEYYRSLPQVYLAFFDTTDGTAPKVDGSNWINANFSGKITACSQGLLYFCGNLAIGGAPAPTITIQNPDEVKNEQSGSTQQGIFHNGVIFTWGNFSNQGNSSIYGSAVVGGTYDGGGTPNIYYNEALRNGQPQPITSNTNILQEQL